ncbi:MAG: ATP-dependent helicase [Thermoleophilaceae bacterium]
MDPTPQQQAVIDHDWTQHARVLAGPGTGKSATAVALAERLSEEDQSLRLRFLTFTRAATSELAQKLLDAPDALVERPSTVHSFSIGALLRNPGAANFPEPLRIPDDWEQKNLVCWHLARLTGVTPGQIERRFIPEMAAMWESLVPEEDPAITPPERATFTAAFREHRWIYGYTLLAELPDLLRRALEEHDDLDGLDYDALVIDEYQDLNACDLRVMRLLAERGVSVIAIGDDDQSIYSFRKAAPEGIRRFCEEFETDCDYPLTVCHRSPHRIVGWSQQVIAGDPHRMGRPPPELPDDAPDGEAVLLRFPNGDAEATGVAGLIHWLHTERDVPLSEILVLTRADHNACFSKPIREALEAYGLESSDPDAIKALLAEHSNRELIAMLRLLVDRADSLAWATLLFLRDRVGPAFVDYVYDRARADGSRFGAALIEAATEGFDEGPKGSADRALELYEEVVERLDACQLPDEDDEGEWIEWIDQQADAGRLPPVGDELRYILEGVEGLLEERQDLGRFLSQISPVGRDLAQAESGGVRFMSMMGSKGLTVRVTILVGVDQDLIPRQNVDLQEERRLLYVAMTRSTEALYLTYARQRYGPQQRVNNGRRGRRSPSMLLEDTGVPPQDGPAYLQGIGA